MNPNRNILWLLVPLLGSFCSEASAGSVMPQTAGQALTGKFAGHTTCGKPVAFELELKAGIDGPGVLNVKGTLKAPLFTTPIGGQLHLADGLLLLQNIVEPVDPCSFHIGSTCMVGRAGSGGGSTVIDDKMNDFFKKRAEKKRADEIARATLQIAAARTDAGDGLQGTVRGESFDCAEFALRRVDGGTRDLPAIDGVLALDAVSAIDANPKMNNSGPSTIYWLKLAADKGDAIALFKLGQAYEAGTTVHPDLPLAVKYYNDAAQRGDAQAQGRLSVLYSKGDGGLPKDAVQSEHWGSLAKTTIESAGKVCATPQIVSAYYDLFRLMSNDPNAFFVKAFGEVLTSTQVQEGKFRIEEVAPRDVFALERPFTCQVFGRSVGYQVTSTAVPTIYEYTSASGTVTYGDNSSDVALSQSMAAVGTAYGSAPVVQPFTIELLTGKHYRVTMSKLIVTEYITKAVEVSVP
jgi:hypothetical protein